MSTDNDNIKDDVQNQEGTDKSVEEKDKKTDKKSKKSKKSKAKKETKEEKIKRELEELQEKYAKLNDDYLRLFSEFDNFRKRKNKEISDLYTTAGEKLMMDIIPTIDDFERALQHIGDSEEAQAHREGLELIYNKFLNILKKHHVAEIDAKGKDFDTDYHEAITRFPAPSEDMKGKVVDVTEKGYTMGDKVIRYAKVVVGE